MGNIVRGQNVSLRRRKILVLEADFDRKVAGNAV